MRPGNLNPYILGYTLADIGTEAVTGEGLSEKIGGTLGNLIGTAIYGDSSQPAITQEERDLINRDINPITGNLNPIALEPLVRYGDPIRSTFTMPDGKVIMERESGERFSPTAEQLQSFTESQKFFNFKPEGTGTNENDLDAITGASRTSNAVESFLNRDLERFKKEFSEILKRRLQENV